MINIQLSLKVLPHNATKLEVYDKVNEVIKEITESNQKDIVEPSEIQLKVIMADYYKDETYINEKLENIERYLGK